MYVERIPELVVNHIKVVHHKRLDWIFDAPRLIEVQLTTLFWRKPRNGRVLKAISVGLRLREVQRAHPLVPDRAIKCLPTIVGSLAAAV